MPTFKQSKSFSWTQFFLPKPHFTEKDIPADLRGKVYIVTGANTGMGKELSRVLYSRGAKVYAACRSAEKGNKAIAEIMAAEPRSKGEIVLLDLDLADLSKVKAAARDFLAREDKLHLLFNNAGVMGSDPMQKTAQGYELTLGVKCVGTFLLTQLLTPALIATARFEPLDTVRVVWLSSFGLEQFAPDELGVDMENLDYHEPRGHIDRYVISKSGDWLLAVEYGRRHRADGIVSVPINPGNLKTELARDQGIGMKLLASALVHPAIYGVYTQLLAAFSPEVTNARVDCNTKWIIPWGRVVPLRPDLTKAVLTVEEGGNANAEQFWRWNEQQVKNYL